MRQELCQTWEPDRMEPGGQSATRFDIYADLG